MLLIFSYKRAAISCELIYQSLAANHTLAGKLDEPAVACICNGGVPIY